MSNYAIFFQKGNVIMQLPVNPEELEISTSQAIEKFDILKLGQISIPTHMALHEYSFEAELPYVKTHYIETTKDFHKPEYYINLFKTWREKLEPIQFMAGKSTDGKTVTGDAINIPVLIESLTITEKAGEEQDKYVTFKLVEYREHNAKKSTGGDKSPSNNGYYTVKSGDTLWAISKKYYASGSLYNKIYNANKDKIRNPNLIYPGQRLVIP